VRADDARPTQLEGIVTALAPGFFEVAANGQSYLCTLRGRLRKPRPAPSLSASQRPGTPRITVRPGKGEPGGRGAVATPLRSGVSTDEPQPPARIAAGDRVRITVISPSEGVVEEVLPRRTVLARSRGEHGSEHVMLANPDVAVLVFATQEPEPHFGLLDRYLALCEHAGVETVICLNKDDLGVPGMVGDTAHQYSSLGYPVLYTSAATGDGVDELRERLKGRISLLTGESGVGKSSLTNLLAPGAAQRTGEISAATGLGRHTTTGVRLLPLPEDGWLADSAGIKELSLWNVPADELAECFVELRPFVGQCLYEDCRHSAEEEGCALRDALQRGTVSPGRWASFERLLADARAEEKPAWETR
jgi:ribosome biogenesis GTPase